MKAKEITDFILGLGSVSTSKPFGQDKLVFSLNDQMFAILDADKLPGRISLKCDPGLSKLLRQKYDEVMPGDHLDVRTWNTIVLAGQLKDEDIQDLIRHSYNLIELGSVTETNEK